MYPWMTGSHLAGSRPAAQCCRRAAGGPAPLRPGLLLPSPAPACHRLSATAAPSTPSITFIGASTAPRTATRAPLIVGAAVRSGDPGPPSGPSHGGGRGRGRGGGSGRQGPREQGGGRGWHEDRVYEGSERDGRQGQGRSSGRGFDLSTLEHLGQLQEVVEQHAKQWADEGEYGTLVTAFDLTCKLPHITAGGPPEAAARRALVHTLARVFLRLVKSVARPDYCTRPLWACAKTGYGWAGGAAEVPLAEALLGRLAEDRFAVLRRAKPKEHANLWWSLSEAPNAALVAAQGQLLAASAERLVGMSARDMVPQDCANVLLACARLKHSPTHVPLVHHLTRCLAELPKPDEQDLSNTLYALGELREDCGHVPHREDLRQLVGAIVQRLQGGRARQGRRAGHEVTRAFKPQGVSNVLLGCAKLGVEDGEAVQLLAGAARMAAVRMDSQGLANSVWALGKLLGGGDDAEGGTGTRTTSAPLVVTAAGCTVAVDAALGLFREVQRRLSPTGHTGSSDVAAAAAAFSSQGLSNLLYGMALLQPYISSPQIGGNDVKDTHVRPAVAALDAARQALAEECQRRKFGGFEPQALANATWALAKMGHADQGWFAAAVAATQRPAFTGLALPMEWAQLWYALALVRHRPPPGLMESTASALEGQVLRVEPQQCASLLWSFAVLGVWEERLAGVLLGRLAELVERQQQGQGLRAGGGVGARAGTQAPLVVVEQGLANALWSVAVTGPGALAAHARQVGVLLREAARRWEQGRGGSQTESFSVEALVQLWQVQLELEAMEGGEGERTAALSLILPGARWGVAGGATAALGGGSLRAAMEHAARESGAVLGDASASASQLQRDVVAALRRLQRRQQEQQQWQQQFQPQASPSEPQCLLKAVGGARWTSESGNGAAPPLVIIDVQHEAPVPALGSRVDVLVPLSNGRVVAMEVDGPMHFLCNSPFQHTKDGPTKLRDRQLARVFGQGNVVSVLHWEWRALRGDEAAEEQYVWGLLVGGEGAGVRAGREAAAAHRTQRSVGRVAEQEKGEGQTTLRVVASAGASGTAEGETSKRRRRRQQAGEQQGLQLQRKAPACAPAGSAAGGAVADGPSGGPGVVEQRGKGRRRRSVEEGAGAAAGTAGQGGQPVQAPPDGATPRVLVPRRRRQKVKVD